VRRFLRRLFTPPLYVLAVLVILVEDFLWDPLQRIVGAIIRRLHLQRAEAWLARRRPYTALALFLVPMALVFPLKLLAVFLMTRGWVAGGVGLLLGAKVAGTAVLARLFTICKPALLSIEWFARAHRWVVGLEEAAMAWLRASAAWRAARALKAAFRARFARSSFLSRRWHAIRARLRRAPDP
jgi:hypothetical protein